MAHKIDEYYRTLELPLNASNEDIRIRYRQLARVYHPDRYSDPGDKEFVEAMMKRINDAYHQITHAPRPQANSQEGISPKPATPTIYRTVKGVPPFQAFMLAGIAFILGAIAVQIFNFTPISNALGSDHLTVQPATVQAVPEVTATASPVVYRALSAQTYDTSTVHAIQRTNAKEPVGEPLAMSANGTNGAFPIQSKSNTFAAIQSADSASQATAIATASETATTQPTATSLPTYTAEPTATVAPTNTVEPTNTTEPAATIAPTDAPVPTDTSVPPIQNNEELVAPVSSPVQTEGGFLFTISSDYNVFARSATSIQSEPAGLLSNGEQIFVLGRTFDNFWLRITLSDGRLAWVYAETVGATPAFLQSLPVVNP